MWRGRGGAGCESKACLTHPDWCFSTKPRLRIDRQIGSVALMAGTISMGARREVLSAVAERYRSAGRVVKGPSR